MSPGSTGVSVPAETVSASSETAPAYQGEQHHEQPGRGGGTAGERETDEVGTGHRQQWLADGDTDAGRAGADHDTLRVRTGGRGRVGDFAGREVRGGDGVVGHGTT